MKKRFTIGLIVIIILAVFAWGVFGFWTLVWTGFVNILSGVLLSNFIGSRKELNGVITFNPKEWPKLLTILICLLVGYYLYTIISVPNISSYDYIYGLSYLILLTGLPVLDALYKLIRDRNDFVKIEGGFLSFRDNLEIGQVDLNKVKKVSMLKDLNIELNDQTNQLIKLSQMNFNLVDRISLLKEIQGRIPQDKETSE